MGTRRTSAARAPPRLESNVTPISLALSHTMLQDYSPPHRKRNFAISRVIPDSLPPYSPDLFNIVRALDYLFLGDGKANYVPRVTRRSDANAALRALRSLSVRTTLYPAAPINCPNSTSTDPLGQDLQTWLQCQDGWTKAQSQVRLPSELKIIPERGSFCPIDVNRIDLPNAGIGESSSWTQYLPPQMADLFKDPSSSWPGDLVDRLFHPYSEAKQLWATPLAAEVACKSGHYPNFLHAADNAGIVSWSIIRDESSTYSALADTICMTPFAVRKDANHDRMISWQRIQNAHMPDPPYVELSTPGSFSHLTGPPQARTTAFLHLHIKYVSQHSSSPWLSRFFPMKALAVSSLSKDLQRRIGALSSRNLLPSDRSKPHCPWASNELCLSAMH